MEKFFVPQMMLNIRLNPRQMERAENLGFSFEFRTEAEIHEKNKMNIEAVGKKKALRLNMCDQTGNVITVGGKLLFSGYKEGKVSNLYSAITDLFHHEYKVSKVHILQKQDQEFGFLRIYFLKGCHRPWKPSQNGQLGFINRHLQRHYRICVGFIHARSENEVANATFNFGGPIVDPKELKEKSARLKNLRIISSNHPRIYRFDKVGK
jgi:hypothetical protein